MHKLILIMLLFSCVVAGVVWTGLASAANPPAEAPAAELPTTKINDKDGAEMVLIPAGEFLMGTSEEELAAWLKAYPNAKREWFTAEMPQRKVYLDGYYMYKHPVTVAQYRKFCQATRRAMPGLPTWSQDDHPIVHVTWADAQAYAAWAGANLPTEAQWEKAARGTDGRIYPWGNEWDGAKCQHSVGQTAGKTAPVGSFSAGASPYGVLDMAGNVWEWCADWYDAGYYKNAPARNPTGPATGTARVLRGSSWVISTPGGFRAAYRLDLHPSSWYYFLLGFRCVLRSPGP